MTRSDSAARCRIRVMKHSACCGHSVPMQVSDAAEISLQNGRSSGRSSISARSPVGVRAAHAAMASTWARSGARPRGSPFRSASKRCRQR